MAAEYDYTLLKSFGTDVLIAASAEIRRPELVSIGNHVSIDGGAFITTAARIGDYVHIGPQTTIIGGARGVFTMGHFCNLAAGTRVICVSDRFRGDGLTGPASLPKEMQDSVNAAPVTLEDFANVGTNAVIMPGVTLAQGTVIGACALVTKSTEPWTVYQGIPAKPVKMRPKDKMLKQARELGYEIVVR